jgi:nucleoside-diphosphate-sugar epimerase
LLHLVAGGGFGNQLFQYAAVRAQAKRLRIGMEIELTFWDKNPPPAPASSDLPEIRAGMCRVFPDAIVHCAAQPSYDLAASRPFDDFDVNAAGTLNLLEAARRHCPASPLVHMSTNKGRNL